VRTPTRPTADLSRRAAIRASWAIQGHQPPRQKIKTRRNQEVLPKTPDRIGKTRAFRVRAPAIENSPPRSTNRAPRANSLGANRLRPAFLGNYSPEQHNRSKKRRGGKRRYAPVTRRLIFPPFSFLPLPMSRVVVKVTVHRPAGDWSIFRPNDVFGEKNPLRKHGPVPFFPGL
jgi:hypothetical protein